MKSTGEVMGFDDDFGMAIAKSQIAASKFFTKKRFSIFVSKRYLISRK